MKTTLSFRKKNSNWPISVYLLSTPSFIIYVSLGKTSFNAFERPLIAEDVPSLTVCFYGTISLQYEKDVSISVFKGDRVADSKLQLAYGTNSMSVSNFIHLKRLFLRPPFDDDTTCLNLNFEFKKENFERTLKNKAIWDRSLGLGMFKILLPKNGAGQNISQVQLFITSQANSYGSLIYQWFDGL